MAAVAHPSWVKPVWSGTNEEAEEMCKAFVRHLVKSRGWKSGCWPRLVFWLGEDSQDEDFDGFPCTEDQLSVAVHQLLDSGLDEWTCYAQFRIITDTACAHDTKCEWASCE